MNPGGKYQVTVLKRARKALASLPPQVRQRLMQSIDNLAQDPRPAGCLKMTGVNSWRIRVGDYRILYDIEDSVLTVLVVDLGHRRDIYR